MNNVFGPYFGSATGSADSEYTLYLTGSSNVVTPPSGYTALSVQAWGAGGGGGGANAEYSCSGGGGGAGFYAEQVYPATSNSIIVSAGLGGKAGTSAYAPTDGMPGDDTYFSYGNYSLKVKGGQGGGSASVNQGGAGGQGSYGGGGGGGGGQGGISMGGIGGTGTIENGMPGIANVEFAGGAGGSGGGNNVYTPGSSTIAGGGTGGGIGGGVGGGNDIPSAVPGAFGCGGGGGSFGSTNNYDGVVGGPGLVILRFGF